VIVVVLQNTFAFGRVAVQVKLDCAAILLLLALLRHTDRPRHIERAVDLLNPLRMRQVRRRLGQTGASPTTFLDRLYPLNRSH